VCYSPACDKPCGYYARVTWRITVLSFSCVTSRRECGSRRTARRPPGRPTRYCGLPGVDAYRPAGQGRSDGGDHAAGGAERGAAPSFRSDARQLEKTARSCLGLNQLRYVWCTEQRAVTVLAHSRCSSPSPAPVNFGHSSKRLPQRRPSTVKATIHYGAYSTKCSMFPNCARLSSTTHECSPRLRTTKLFSACRP
jgi:hypothetical protein